MRIELPILPNLMQIQLSFKMLLDYKLLVYLKKTKVLLARKKSWFINQTVEKIQHIRSSYKTKTLCTLYSWQWLLSNGKDTQHCAKGLRTTVLSNVIKGVTVLKNCKDKGEEIKGRQRKKESE